MKKYKLISVHYTNECNLSPRCSFCYKTCKEKKVEKPREFWYQLIPFISKLTDQCVLGGGESFIDSSFVSRFANLCKQNNLICNVTTNGRNLMNMSDQLLKETVKDIKMISISYDNEKIKNHTDEFNYFNLVKRIKKLTNCQVGCNLLVDKSMFKKNGTEFILLVEKIFKLKVDRVFALIMKNNYCVDILKFKKIYQYLTKKYNNFYVDDCSKQIIESNNYTNWKKTCHRGVDMISVNEDSFVSSCSFAKPFTKLEKPKDILNIEIPKNEIGKNYCPFLKIPKHLNSS